jgi:Flp pilus assembly protein TadD/DNA-binding transcriptional MerR regulator
MEATERFSTSSAARILQSTEAQVRRLAELGGLSPETGPGGRYEFTFQQLLLMRTTRGLLEAGIPARRVRRVWTSLRRQLSDDLPLTSIRILANGDRAVVWDGTSRWQPDSGQFLLDFDAGEVAESAGGAAGESAEPASIAAAAPGGAPSVRPWKAAATEPAAERPAALASGQRAAFAAGRSLGAERPGAMEGSRGAEGSRVAERSRAAERTRAAAEAPALTAEQWFHLGCELESTSPIEARQAYLHALAADPGYADAHLNLGRLHHEEGELGKAEAYYRSASRCAPDDATCHFNLAVLLEDRGRAEEAVFAYEQAIARDPEFADAHYNLGLLLEGKGRRADAMKHLMEARRLYAAGRGN